MTYCESQQHEHYADGDLFDVAQPAGYHLMDRAGLYQWGPDLPDDFLDARIAPSRLLRLLRRGLKDRELPEKDDEPERVVGEARARVAELTGPIPFSFFISRKAAK